MTFAVTSIDPLASAPAVEDPEISAILDLTTGKFIRAAEFIGSFRYDDFVKKVRLPVREDLERKIYRYACALCSTPVYVVASADKKFFFRHIEEDGSCRACTRGALSMAEIRARQYYGQRESEAHKRIKALIERSLAVDPEFQTVALERTWRSARDPKARRQPDVQTRSRRFGAIAFEAQLSNSFLSEIAGRRAFYRENGGLLVWILGHFAPEYRRMALDDILFSNNSNVFTVDEETAAVSEKRRALHLRCHYRRPRRAGSSVVDEWQEEIVAFADLTRDVETQTSFFFDYVGEEKRLRAMIAADEEAERERVDEALRDEFFALWASGPQFPLQGDSDLHARWQELSSALASRGIEIPHLDPNDDRGFRAMVNGVLSARDGKPVGWRFDTLLQVAHCIFDQHKGQLFTFGCALRHYERDRLIEAQDKHGKWAKRRREIIEALRRFGSDFEPDSRWLPALLFLFPEIGKQTEKRIASFNRTEADCDF